jgi:hypothetical protein
MRKLHGWCTCLYKCLASGGVPKQGGARNVQTIYGQLVNWNTFSTISQPVGSCRGVGTNTEEPQ